MMKQEQEEIQKLTFFQKEVLRLLSENNGILKEIKEDIRKIKINTS